MHCSLLTTRQEMQDPRPHCSSTTFHQTRPLKTLCRKKNIAHLRSSCREYKLLRPHPPLGESIRNSIHESLSATFLFRPCTAYFCSLDSNIYPTCATNDYVIARPLQRTLMAPSATIFILLLPLLFIAVLSPVAHAFPSVPSFVRQSSSDPPCPCICNTKNINKFNPCQNLGPPCQVLRCPQRNLGYACCDGSATPSPPPTRQKGQGKFNEVSNSLQGAAEQEPELARDAANILFRCSQDIGGLIGEDEGSSNGSGPGNRQGKGGKGGKGGKTVRMIQHKLAAAVFRQFAKATKATLEYIYSNLVKYLR